MTEWTNVKMMLYKDKKGHNTFQNEHETWQQRYLYVPYIKRGEQQKCTPRERYYSRTATQTEWSLRIQNPKEGDRNDDSNKHWQHFNNPSTFGCGWMMIAWRGENYIDMGDTQKVKWHLNACSSIVGAGLSSKSLLFVEEVWIWKKILYTYNL